MADRMYSPPDEPAERRERFRPPLQGDFDLGVAAFDLHAAGNDVAHQVRPLAGRPRIAAFASDHLRDLRPPAIIWRM